MAAPQRPSLLRFVCLLFCACLGLTAAIPSFSFHAPASQLQPLARDIRAEVRHPDGKSHLLPAFADGPGRWTVRAMPTQTGIYQFVSAVEYSDGRATGLPVSLESAASFKLESIPGASLVRVSKQQPNRFVHADGRPYYPFGINLAWPLEADRLAFYRKSFDQFRAAGLNWTRIWCSNWGGLNLDWTQDDLGESPAPGELQPKVAQLWDAIIEEATTKGIYVQMVFQHHGQYSSKVDSNWYDNPWNAAKPGGFLKTPSEFFTDERAKALTKQKYRYIVARWGWSPAILAWELFNEVYQTDAYLHGDVQAVCAWHAEMAAYLRSIDPYGHLVTTSLNDLRSPIWEHMDYLQPHLYAANVIDSVRQFYPSLAGITKPVFYGEVGDDAVLLPRELLQGGRPIIDSLWSSIMGMSEYPAQAWYPERLLTPKRLEELSVLSRFIEINQLASQTDLRPFLPAVSSADTVDLVVPAGHWWVRRPPSLVKIPSDGSQAPDLALVPRAFVGSPDSIADGYPSEISLSAHFPEPATASLRLNDVGGYGARLRVRVDGREVLSCNWAESQKGDPSRPRRGATLEFQIPEGQHTLCIDNPGGPDWFDFHSINLGIPTPALAVAGRRGENLVLMWLWHKELYTQASTETEAIVTIPELPAGEWAITWWNTETGALERVSSVQHPGGDYSLKTPPIKRDAAVALRRIP